MPNHLIAVMGELGADTIDSAVFKCFGTLIVSGMHKQHDIATYACTNRSEDLDMLMKQRSDNTTVVAPRSIYAKYVWEKGIECVPDFEDLRDYQWNPNTCSQQLMSLALACWIGSPVIAVFDYMLEPKTETPAFRALLTLYPGTRFLYVRAVKGNKIKLFEKVPNFSHMDQKEFLNFYKKYAESK
jgi:hypothetical protein